MINNKIKKYDKIRYLYQNKYLQTSLLQQGKSSLIRLIQFQKQKLHQQQKQHNIIKHQKMNNKVRQISQFYEYNYTQNNYQYKSIKNAQNKEKMRSNIVQIKYQKQDSLQKKASRIYHSNIRTKMTQQNANNYTQKNNNKRSQNKSSIVNLSKLYCQNQKKKYSIINLINQLKSHRQQQKIIAQNNKSDQSNRLLTINKNTVAKHHRQKRLTQRSIISRNYSRQKLYSQSQKARNLKLIDEKDIQNRKNELNNSFLKDCSIQPWIITENNTIENNL